MKSENVLDHQLGRVLVLSVLMALNVESYNVVPFREILQSIHLTRKTGLCKAAYSFCGFQFKVFGIRHTGGGLPQFSTVRDFPHFGQMTVGEFDSIVTPQIVRG